MTLVAERPGPGAPRPYRFPSIVRLDAAGGKVVAADLPGHNLAVAALLLDAGAGREPLGREGLAVVGAWSGGWATPQRDARYGRARESMGTDLHRAIGTVPQHGRGAGDGCPPRALMARRSAARMTRRSRAGTRRRGTASRCSGRRRQRPDAALEGRTVRRRRPARPAAARRPRRWPVPTADDGRLPG